MTMEYPFFTFIIIYTKNYKIITLQLFLWRINPQRQKRKHSICSSLLQQPLGILSYVLWKELFSFWECHIFSHSVRNVSLVVNPTKETNFSHILVLVCVSSMLRKLQITDSYAQNLIIMNDYSERIIQKYNIIVIPDHIKDGKKIYKYHACNLLNYFLQQS